MSERCCRRWRNTKSGRRRVCKADALSAEVVRPREYHSTAEAKLSVATSRHSFPQVGHFFVLFSLRCLRKRSCSSLRITIILFVKRFSSMSSQPIICSETLLFDVWILDFCRCSCGRQRLINLMGVARRLDNPSFRPKANG